MFRGERPYKCGTASCHWSACLLPCVLRENILKIFKKANAFLLNLKNIFHKQKIRNRNEKRTQTRNVNGICRKLSPSLGIWPCFGNCRQNNWWCFKVCVLIGSLVVEVFLLTRFYQNFNQWYTKKSIRKGVWVMQLLYQ